MGYIGAGPTRFNTADELTVTGDAEFNGNATFGDNDKAVFGASSDLQIFHDAGNSRIVDAGTGNLNLQADNNVNILNNAGTEFKAQFITDGAVNLFYDNSKKFETTATGIDVTGNAVFDDNGKAIFGAGNDLQIYHDGTNSYVQDAGTGDLRISGNNVNIMNGAATENYIVCTNNGSVAVKHDNATKLETSSTGIDVTGNVTSDGLRLGDGDYAAFGDGLDLQISHSGTGSFITDAGTGDLHIRADNNLLIQDAAGSANRMAVNSSGVGIGTTSPSELLHVDNASGDAAIRIDGNTRSFKIEQNNYGLRFVDVSAASAERMRITSGGNVGIGTSSPGEKLEVYGASPFIYINNTDETAGGIKFADTQATATQNAQVAFDCSSQTLQFSVNNGERVRIESDGDLHADGNVIAYSTTISDPRLKENIEPVTDALSKVEQLTGYTFSYKADGVQSAGVMSTDVKEILPSAVKSTTLPLKTDGDNQTEYDVVQYDQLHALLIEAVKELSARVKELENGTS